MISRQLQGRSGNPFVRLRTIQDFSEVASKIAYIRESVSQIQESEAEMMSEETSESEWKNAVKTTGFAAKKGKEWCDDTIIVLNRIKRKSEGYLRELQNAAD